MIIDLLTTPHVLLGLFFIHNFPPYIALPAALIAHVLFDIFYPHWNPHLFTEMKEDGHLSQNTFLIIIVDLIIAGLTVLYFLFQAYPNFNQISFVILASILSILPDLVEMPYYIFKSKNKFIKKLVTFEHLHQAQANIFWGSLSQLLVIVLCLWQLL